MAPSDEHLALQRDHELASLRWNWAGAYDFTWTDGQYQAARTDKGAVMRAATAGLRTLVIRDYTDMPVPRRDMDGEDGTCDDRDGGTDDLPGPARMDAGHKPLLTEFPGENGSAWSP